MLHKYITDVEQLRNLLREKNQPYLLHSELPSQKVCIQVEGSLNAENVVWNMCIRTIADYSIENEVKEDPEQFIDIQCIKGVYLVEIGLNVSEIDRPTIERTIVMIRKYKRLHIGRHEYGARSKTI